ncbi:MAG: TrkH family potassium uptake protein [Alphaproteobacteria bacterium]|nr:TrkH family potassium uptake protein [Alphaproteobacteria bacterium]
MIKDLRSTAFINGILISILGAAMIIPAIISISMGEQDWKIFTSASTFCLFIGVSLSASTYRPEINLTVRSAFFTTVFSWLLLATFSALPFAWSNLYLSYTDSFFEAMSGLTTTGSTVIENLDKAPLGILLWRALLQWLGGLGIIVMAIAILPMLQIGGMQLFKVEASDNFEKVLPRTKQISSMLTTIYILFTVLCAIAYNIAGMHVFDAIVHAMTTIATGGFSTHDASIAYFGSTTIENIAIFFMIIGSLPFVLYIKSIQSTTSVIFRDSQVKTFFLFLTVFSGIAALAQLQSQTENEWSAHDTLFNVTSIMTGTGYVNAPYDSWGPLSVALFLFIMFVGGCASSTSCGIKIFRFQVIYLTMKQYLNQILYPHGVFVPYYNGKPLTDQVIGSVMSFLFLYILTVAFFSLLLTLDGYDLITSLSASATAVSNVGPGLGQQIGPSSTFSGLSSEAKWILSIAMLMGRLELLTVLVLLSKTFWQE